MDSVSTARIHIAHFGTGLGLGGDAKNLLALAREQSSWARVSVLTLDSESGSRARVVPPQVELVSGIGGSSNLATWLAASAPDCLFIHRGGEASASDTELLRACAALGISTFEYSTFARLDRDTDLLWTGHVHISRAGLVHYARRRGCSPLDMPDQLAAGYAVDVCPPVSAEERIAARAYLGLPRDGIVAVRLMRPDLRKWDPSPVLGVRRAVRGGAAVHLVVREAPAQCVPWARRALGANLTLLPATMDADDVRATLACADVLVNYSSIGESFGLALAEGMMCGLVPIVNATPNADNAQIELCENGVSGIVANGPQALADAFAFLAVRPDARARLGAAARQSMLDKFSAPVVERRIRHFLIERLRTTGKPAWRRIPEPDEDAAYVFDSSWLTRYEWAEGSSFRKAPISLIDLVDDLEVRALRANDALRYAQAKGPRVVARALASRFKRGSLRRA